MRMAKRKKETFVERLEHTVGDMADAVSYAATGSAVGTLELAAEDELGDKKPKTTKKKKRLVKRTKKVRKTRTAKRRKRL
jgi:hypothetical protein